MVRAGYKQTEVGVIPEDWEVITLYDASCNGGLVRGPFGGTIKKEYFVKNGFKVYEQRNAIYGTTEIGTYFVDSNKYKDLLRFSVKAGDFIVSCSGTIGRIFQIPDHAPEGIINQALLKIQIDQKVIDRRYFQFVFRWDKFQERIIDNSHGGAMQNLVGMDIFKNTLLPLPPKQEQLAIADTLSDVDALIAALDNLIAKKRAIKIAAMQQLLTGKTRLPGFGKQWAERSLGELINYERPDKYIVNNTEYSDYGDIPVLTANKSFVLGYTNESFGVFWDFPIILFDDFTTDCKFVDFPFKVKSSAIKILSQKVDEVNLRYIFERIQLIQFPIGDHKRYYISEYQNIKFKIPEFEEQNTIARILSNMDVEIAALETRRDKTYAIKQGMMQELLTGKTRLLD
jgi:type I restriction enzyme S subunit